MHRYWMAANYLTVGTFFCRTTRSCEHRSSRRDIKPRLLGHWGTSPGLNLVYVHLNRIIAEQDANVIYLAGPGHGGPAIVANVYLEGTYSEVYPAVSRDLAGLRRLFRQFSTPGGIPTTSACPTPGSIHEGGELGYVLSHAFGAAFDNPDLIVAAVVGDGEAETAPLEGAWKSTSFLNPARDGAVLPILHLNGYKISGPTVLAGKNSSERRHPRCSRETATTFTPWPATMPLLVHQANGRHPRAHVWTRIRAMQTEARATGAARVNADGRGGPRSSSARRKAGPGPRVVDGLPVEGTFRFTSGTAASRTHRRRRARDARRVAPQLRARHFVR